MAHGGGVEAVVEVATRDGGFEYGLAFAWSDGDPVTGAHIVMRATQGDLVEVAEPVEVSPGVYVGTMPLVSGGEWQVAIAIHHPESNGNINFVQLVVPDGGAVWSVLVDTANEERVGLVPDPLASVLDPPTPVTSTTIPVSESEDPPAESTEATPTTEPPIVDAEPAPVGTGEVVVDIATAAQGPEVDIGMRIVHLIAIGLWIVPVVAWQFGKKNPLSAIVAVTGVSLTLVSGAVLMHWGAPISYPGLFNWGEVADLSYGSQYLSAFSAKLASVLIAALATVWWAVAADRRAAWVALGFVTVAVVAVTAMSQFHILSHV